MNTLFKSFLVILFICGSSKLLSQPLHVFKFQTVRSGPVIRNVASNMNNWSYAPLWHNAMENEPDDHFRKNMPYVKYVQLMTAAGGNEQRDLFKNPLDRTVMDDYDFSPLIRACKNILRQGLIPHLKLGNVPLKYSGNPQIGVFGVNKCPPDDYNLWHAYIKAMIKSLSDEFGLKTVRSWRFGVVTEYENKDWFSVDDDPVKSRDAYFALYDYTVDALEQVLGKNVCVGAHSMTVSDGLWDERELIVHCARGKNFCTGKTGTRLCFIAASYYDNNPGVAGKYTLSETINMLRDVAVKERYKKLFYGIDEGRILFGFDQKHLGPRAVGYTWQAAYDARLYHTMIDENIDYFSHWAYTTSGILSGALSVAAHTADLFYRMTGSVRLPGKYETTGNEEGKVGGIAAFNKKQNKLYVLFYAYSDSVFQSGQREISCELAGLGKISGKVKATRTLISDDSNYFDELLADRAKEDITQKDFGWSSDSFVISATELPNAAHLKLFRDRIPYYMSCSALKPVSESLTVKDGILNIRTEIPVHGVSLYEIALDSVK